MLTFGVVPKGWDLLVISVGNASIAFEQPNKQLLFVDAKWVCLCFLKLQLNGWVLQP